MLPLFIDASLVEGIFIDITERKMAERRLAAQHAITHVLAESTTLGEAIPQTLQAIGESLECEIVLLWEVDPYTQMLGCSHTWYSLRTKVTAFEEISRRTYFPAGVGLPGRVWKGGEPAWIPDVLQDANFQRTAFAAESGFHGAFAFPLLAGKEMLGVVESFSRQIQQPDADLLQMLTAVGSQIGQFMERKRAEEALRQSQERTRLIIDTALDAVVTMDSEGRITAWNTEAENIFGWSREEAVGRLVLETIVPQRHREAHTRSLQHFLGTGEGPGLNKRIEITALHRNGREFPVELAICPARMGGGWSFSAFIRDITERKRAEEMLRRSHDELERRVLERTAELAKAKEAAEAASRAKSDFVANMSHEIRTPMNGIIGMTELALDTPLTDEQRDYLETVKSSADTMLRVINDILDFSKIEAKKLDLEIIEFNLRPSLGEALKTLTFRAREKGLEISSEVQPDIPKVLMGDPSRLRQILLNLVGNAIKFTSQGEIIVTVETVSQTATGIDLHFRVTDTGIGIPPEKQKLIFEAFTQVDNSSTRKYGGTGLGLTISSQLVEMMKGRIWVESKLGQGSTFHFTAHFGFPPDQSSRLIQAAPEVLNDLPALVVDDNAINRLLLEGLLTRWGMRPTLASSGEEALSILQSRSNFSLILLDHQMPDMDGFILAQKIAGHPSLTDAAVIMLSSVGQRGDAGRCRELGVAAYLLKPFQQSELLEAILTALGNRSQGQLPLITRHWLRESRVEGRQLRILLAEDNIVNQKLAVRLLEKRGYEVVVAGNGRQALAAMEKEPFHLVLMDVQMPEMDGLEATAMIREKERGSDTHLPIIAMTAHAMQGDRENFLAAGMDGYVSKPIDARALFKTIEELSRQQKIMLLTGSSGNETGWTG